MKSTFAFPKCKTNFQSEWPHILGEADRKRQIELNVCAMHETQDKTALTIPKQASVAYRDSLLVLPFSRATPHRCKTSGSPQRLMLANEKQMELPDHDDCVVATKPSVNGLFPLNSRGAEFSPRDLHVCIYCCNI